MNKEDIKFLNDLKNEMLTQDTCCQANPRFWVIRQEERIYWCDNVVSNGFFIFDNNKAEIIFEGDNKDIPNYLISLVNELYENGDIDCNLEEVNVYSFGGIEIDFKFNGNCYTICDEIDLEYFLKRCLDMDVELGYYQENYIIQYDTFFMTLREAKEHLEKNKHHYNSTAKPYAMTAWRSPQVERLYEIIQNTDWSELDETN